MAEALLIAEYGWRPVKGELPKPERKPKRVLGSQVGDLLAEEIPRASTTEKL